MSIAASGQSSPPDRPQAQVSWPSLFAALIAGEDLDSESASWAMNQIMSGDATPVQVSGFLVALRAKGETVAEVRGLADQMLRHAMPMASPAPSLDIVGTGGDRAHTVNISTMSAIVAAAAGVPVVKHGNRAASSASGSADVLEALGVDLSRSPDHVRDVLAACGITFCFAQAFHPSMRHAAVARRELGIATVFNFLGPLTNPGQPTFAAVGCADARMAPLIAGVFADRGRDAVVFRGDDGLDEVTLSTTTSLWWVRSGQVTSRVLDPRALGVPYAPIEALRGGDATVNADVVRALLAGAPGPVRDAVVLNTGVALAITAPDSGADQRDLNADILVGMERAAVAIDSGAAGDLLERWVLATTS